MTREDFLKRAYKAHPNGGYNYDKVPEKVMYYDRLTIVCEKHGEFIQQAGRHYEGGGCSQCYDDRRGKTIAHTTEEFVRKAKSIHGEFYDYSKVVYKNNITHVEIICPKHGSFWQKPGYHTNSKSGCPTCGLSKITGAPRVSKNHFVEKSTSVHGDKYDYTNSSYVNVRTPINIMCEKHGEFYQLPSNHTAGRGCPKCPTIISSQHQTIMDWLDEINIKYIVNDREFISPKELDIYIPDHNLAIEVNGEWYHTDNNKKNDRHYHYNKYKECSDKGVRLLQFWAHTEIEKKPEIVKSMLYNALGFSKRVFARKCEIVELDTNTYREFMEENHLEGYNSASVRLGLTYEGELLSAVGFARKGSGWELIRLVTKKGYTVVGGFSKLMKRRPEGSILTYSHNDYSDGGVYEDYGFELQTLNKNTLFYWQKGKLHNRNHFMKHKLLEQLGLDNSDKTESELALELGAYQVFGSGTRTWILNNS